MQNCKSHRFFNPKQTWNLSHSLKEMKILMLCSQLAQLLCSRNLLLHFHYWNSKFHQKLAQQKKSLEPSISLRFLFRKFELSLFSDPTETLLESHETLLPKEEQELESTGKARNQNSYKEELNSKMNIESERSVMKNGMFSLFISKP